MSRFNLSPLILALLVLLAAECHCSLEKGKASLTVSLRNQNAEISVARSGSAGPKGLDLRYASNCVDVMSGRISGVYTLNVRDPRSVTGYDVFNVYCIQDNQPWTIVQRRQDGTENFFRNWRDYVRGFGSSAGEYWLGLERLYRMTNAQPMQLWVQLEDHKGVKRSAFYSEFVIGDASSGYELKGYGNYTGDAGNSFWGHLNQKFTTKDFDNDARADANCAIISKGAWWYNNCHVSNLNGRYNDTTFGQGINWKSFRKYTYSLKYAHMALRPRFWVKINPVP